jgi:hypothetical protein
MAVNAKLNIADFLKQFNPLLYRTIACFIIFNHNIGANLITFKIHLGNNGSECLRDT